MATLTIRDIPEELYVRLKQRAKANRRSISREIIWCIEQVVGAAKAPTEERLQRAREFRARTAQHAISDREFDAAKEFGRP